MKTHKRINDLLAGLALGELTQSDAAQVREHLDECQQCRNELKHIEALQAHTERMRQMSADEQACGAARESLAAAIANKQELPARAWFSSVGIRRTIMKSRMMRPVAAAAVLVLVGILGFWPQNGSNGKVYGMSDAVALIEQARTIHTIGHVDGYYPVQEEGEFVRQPYRTESWIDVENERMRYTSFIWHRAVRGRDAYRQRVETVIDGKYYMKVNHSTKSVQFFRLSDFLRKAYTRHTRDNSLDKIYLVHEDLSEYERIGQEEIDGETFDIWQRYSATPHPYGGLAWENRNQYWVSPMSGKMQKAQHWYKHYEHMKKDLIVEEEWQLESETEWEINTLPPVGTFDTVPPEGYRLENTKGNAPVYDDYEGRMEAFMIDNSMKGRKVTSFAFPNGIVIMGWWVCDIVPGSPQAKAFDDMEPGASLPTLPVELLYGLAPRPKQWSTEVIFEDTSIVYADRYLAHTQKNGKLYEWAIYIPSQEINKTELLRRCDVIVGMDREKRRWRHARGERKKPGISLFIEEDEFDTFVRGALANWSEDGVAPDHVTYDLVMQLVDEIRQSIE